MSDKSTILGELLRIYCATYEIHQSALARKTGIPESVLSNLLRGKGGLSSENALRLMLWLLEERTHLHQRNDPPRPTPMADSKFG